MNGIQKLTWQQLESIYPPSSFSFKTTDDLELLDEIIGQERAKKAMEFGLCVEAQGYNIYIAGEAGMGKTTFAKRYAKRAASQKQTAKDWCYVYNFREKRAPRALCLDAGDGREFKNDMNELITYLTEEIPCLYKTKEYEERKRNLLHKYQTEKESYIEELKKHAKLLSFIFDLSEEGISFSALDHLGNPISEQAFEALDKEQQMKIENSHKILQDMTVRIIKEIKDVEQVGVQDLENLVYQTALSNTGYYIKILKEKYTKYTHVLEYLDDLQQDILEHVDVFIQEPGEQQTIALLPWIETNSVKKLVRKYDVNLLVDHSKSVGAPVIIGTNLGYNKIIGELEYDNEFGSLSTDYMKIKPGLFHQANGGYLILQVEDVLTNHEAWHAIKQVIKTRQLYIENSAGITIETVASLKPEAIPISVKVILIGSLSIYHLLYEGDSDFKKLFKIKADFDREMFNTQSNSELVARFIKTFCNQHHILPLTQDAVRVILRYATRCAGNQKKITTEFSRISNLLIEANTFAKLEESKLVDSKHVQLAITEKRYRVGRYEAKLQEQIIDNVIMIQTTGSCVGEINALTIHDTGEYRFGQPTKITATTYKGARGIVNVEKEAKLSGSIHTKGSQIIEGYLGQIYGQNFPLSITCRVCFEQNYGKIDGDSASSAELYAIISSLSGFPIKQNIAVTGSVNQHGLIQPVGGVTHKVEGFFEICKKRGLTGDQGVIIPKQNIQDLVLDSEIIEAIKAEQFHIYAIFNVQDGLELLMGKHYQEIKEKVESKLSEFNVKS